MVVFNHSACLSETFLSTLSNNRAEDMFKFEKASGPNKILIDDNEY